MYLFFFVCLLCLCVLPPPSNCRRGVGGLPGNVVIPQRVQQAVANAAVNELVGALGKQMKFN